MTLNIFEKNLDKLLATLSHADSPLIRYSANLQISFLDPDQKQDDLINKAASLLKDALYFMMLPKKERTSVTQRMRANTIRFLIFIAVFALMLILEVFIPRHPIVDSKIRRVGINLALTGVNILLVRLVFGAAAVGAAGFAEGRENVLDQHTGSIE